MTVVCNIEKDTLNMTNSHEENTTLCKLMKTNLYVKAIQAWVIYNIMVIMSFATAVFLSIKYDNAL